MGRKPGLCNSAHSLPPFVRISGEGFCALCGQKEGGGRAVTYFYSARGNGERRTGRMAMPSSSTSPSERMHNSIFSR